MFVLHTSTPARRLPNNTSTPAHSDCSPFSIATISSPLLQTPIYPQSTTNAATSPTLRYNLRPLPANNDNYTKTSCANNELRGNRKRSHQYHKSTPKDSSDNDYPLPALQAAQKVDNNKQNFRQGDEGSWKGSSWNNNLGSMKNDFDQNRPKKRQWEQNNDKYVIDKADRGINRKYQKELYNRRNEHANARNQNEKKDNNEEYHNSSVEESIKETGYTNLYEYYKERKRKADEEKEKDVEAQRGVRDKLAALAGGYLTGEGKSTGKLNSKRPSSIRGKNISVEVIDIEDDAEGDEVIAIDTEGNCENIVR